MFGILKKKILFYIIGMSTIITFVIFLILFLLYSFFLSNDFEQKNVQSHTQIATNLENEISYIESALDTFIINSHLDETFVYPEATSINYNLLSSIKTYCPRIDTVFVHLENNLSYFPSVLLDDKFRTFIKDFNIRESLLHKTTCWTFVENVKYSYSDSERDYWLCTKPIFNANDKSQTIGYITALVPTLIYSSTGYEFLTNDTYYLCTQNGIGPFYKGETEISQPLLKDIMSGNKVSSSGRVNIYYSDIFDGEISIISCTKSQYIYSLLGEIGKMLAFAFLFTFLLCLIIGLFLSKIIVGDLGYLCNKVNKYCDGEENYVKKG